MLQYSDKYDCVVSADEGGFVEYWQPLEPFELPRNVHGLWSYKSETDLYEFKKVRFPFCILRVRKPTHLLGSRSPFRLASHSPRIRRIL